MKKLLPFSVLALATLIFASSAFAQDATPSSTSTNVKPKIPAAVQRIDQRKDAALKRLEDKRSQAAVKIQNREAKIASRTAQLKARLQTFKNKVKAETAERVSNNLNKINSNRTEQMTRHLQKMSEILDRVEKKVTEDTASGNTASGSAAIADARDAIDKATEAVEAQSQKDYTVTVSTEDKIRADVKKQRDLLFADLQGSRKLVIQAKQAVADAIKTVRSGKGREAANGQ